MQREPFFIIGAPRSGTTMLQLALSRHSEIVIPPETGFFSMVLWSRAGQRRHWQCIKNDLQIQIDPPDQRIRPGESAREHFLRIADAYKNRVGHRRAACFGEKSPQHQLRTREIIHTFPDAKFVMIYRDGRDVALSMTKHPALPADLYVSFWVWLHFYSIQCQLLQREPHRILCIRYEDLVRNPEPELRKVLHFLGLEYEAQVAEGSGNQAGVPDYELSYKGRALKPISSSRIGVWRRELTQAQVGRLERWGHQALRDLGYECVTNGRKFLPPWHFPTVYSRLAVEVATRTLQRKVDELFGTCWYRPNRIARELPEPEQRPLVSMTGGESEVTQSTLRMRDS